MAYRDIEKRLVRLETCYADDDGGGFTVWVPDDDDGHWMIGPDGERMLAAELAEQPRVVDIGVSTARGV